MSRRSGFRSGAPRVAVCIGAIVLTTMWALPDRARARAAPGGVCRATTPAGVSEAGVRAALAHGRDVWGEQLLRAPGGPTLVRARRYLPPLLLARGPRKTALTDSGVYYLPFGQPDGPRGAGSVALHVADGSQIIAERVGGRALTVRVGPDGQERFGMCLARISPARLGSGYLPILETGYRDAVGARYRQESFVAYVPQTRSLVSFVRLDIDTRRAARTVVVRLDPSVVGLHRAGMTLRRGAAAQLAFSAGATVTDAGVSYRRPVGTQTTIYAAWLVTPSRLRELSLDAETYTAAKESVARYWDARLASAMRVSVPERAVMNGLRAVMIQSLVLTWRYSIGNPYEQFSFPESPDVARVLAEYGLAPTARSVLRTSLTRNEELYRNWKRGSRLVALADYARLCADTMLIREVTPTLRSWVADFERQLRASRRGLLARERYSSDIPDRVYGLHGQAMVWEGLREIAGVWRAQGQTALAVRASAVGARLERGLRRAVASSQRHLRDGSLFVPVQLLDREQPYGLVVEQRLGSYWNLVVPYALASGLFTPGSPQAIGALRYLELHGGRLLGIVRAGAYALYGPDAYPSSGTNQVYNTSVVRFLADNDESDQLVLSLYGSLAAGMTAGTFVAGEAASVAPLPGTPYRAMYLPPNGGANIAFLETVRSLLVDETRDRAGTPSGLRLAYATPRGWLRPGQRIAVTGAPTSFGPVSYAIAAGISTVTVALDAPEHPPSFLGLRVRLPAATRITRVELDGAPYANVDRTTGTINLSGADGHHTLTVHVVR